MKNLGIYLSRQEVTLLELEAYSIIEEELEKANSYYASLKEKKSRKK